MEKIDKPNIFNFATTELTQDAFIAWLCSWADPKYQEVNKVLNETANRLIEEFFRLHSKKLQAVRTIKVLTQVKDIDVLLIINEEFYVIIEDKVHSKAHSGQLEKYINSVKSDYEVDTSKTIPIFFKTGDQCNYAYAEGKGYEVYKRSQFLNLLSVGINKGVTNQVFAEYYNYLKSMDDEINSYKFKKVEKWDFAQWIGFYQKIKDQFDHRYWEYVSNPSGGFMAFWWNRIPINDNKQEVYIQVERDRLCFKISNTDKTAVKNGDKWYWKHKVEQIGNLKEYTIRKPKKFGSGKWVTFAVLEHKNTDNSNYWLKSDSSGKVNVEETINLMKDMGEVLNQSVKLHIEQTKE